MNGERVGALLGELRKILGELEQATSCVHFRGEAEAPWVRSVLRARRLRAAYFGEALFADPAWDMMLDLLAARLEGRSVGVSSLCMASGVPATTGLRWVRILEERGIVVRRKDASDGRRVFVDLSADAATRLQACLCDIQAVVPQPA